MKSKLVFIILLVCSALFGGQIEELGDVYTVKAGDIFLIQVFDIEVQQMKAPVTINGNVILYPLRSPLKVSGMTVSEAVETIKTELSKAFINAEIYIELADFSVHRINIIGAVSHPGEFVADTLMTLYQSLKMAGGLVPSASKKVDLVRRGTKTTYDLREFLRTGEQSHNPIVFGEDLIIAKMAEEFARVYVVTDSVNYFEYIETDGKTPVEEYLTTLNPKYRYSNYKNLFLNRNGEIIPINKDYIVKNGDKVYLQPEENYVFVRGNVNSPGRFNYFAGKTPQFYISLAGGINRVGSTASVNIISKDGIKKKYKGQPLREGDTVMVPLAARTYVTDYLTPIATILSLITTIVVLAR